MRLIDVLVERAVLVGAIAEEDSAMYRYSYSNMLFALLVWGLFIVVGLLLGQLLGCLLFLVFFIPLRQFAGGFHQRSKPLCLFSSLLLFAGLFGLAASPVVQSSMTLGLRILLLPAALVLLVYAPQADENKPISENEHRVFCKATRIVLCVELVLHGAMWWFGFGVNLCYFALMATVLAAVMVLTNVVHITIKNQFSKNP